MLVSIVPIGNSKGIRLPKSILDQLQISDQLELEVTNKQIILTPVTKQPRSGWEEAFRNMSEHHEDTLVLADGHQPSGLDWEW